MTTTEALEIVATHGIVLESARGPVPSLAEMVAGAPIRGSWWSHPKAHAIHAVTQAVRNAPDVLVCRLVDGKVTFVHRRLWPALVRLAERFPQARLAAVREVHTSKGHHELKEVSYPDWVPDDVRADAAALTEQQAADLLGPVSPSSGR